MEKLLATGKTKAIGVSNYSVKYLNELLPHCSIMPAVNQIENRECNIQVYRKSNIGTKKALDPYLPQQDIHEFCKAKGILIEAYSPLGSTGSPLFNEKVVEELAERYRVSAGTILISYQGMEFCLVFNDSR